MRILVVDDSSPHRRMLTAIFGHAGHQVLTAADGEAALALLERESVNAVVSDVRMPKLDGFQLCRAIRRDARWARLPFIFYSSVFIGGRARDTVLSRLDHERQALAERTDRKVEAAQLALLKELGEFLGDRINNPLAVIMASAQLLEMRAPSSATSEAAERITTAVSKINAVVREIASKSGEMA